MSRMTKTEHLKYCLFRATKPEFMPMTAAELKPYTCKELVVMAKSHDIRGWHAMRKHELIRALVSATKTNSAKRRGRRSRIDSTAITSRQRASTAPETNGTSRSNGRHKARRDLDRTTAVTRPKGSAEKARRQRDLSNNGQDKPDRAQHADRLLVSVCDPHWLQVERALSSKIKLHPVMKQGGIHLSQKF